MLAAAARVCLLVGCLDSGIGGWAALASIGVFRGHLVSLVNGPRRLPENSDRREQQRQSRISAQQRSTNSRGCASIASLASACAFSTSAGLYRRATPHGEFRSSKAPDPAPFERNAGKTNGFCAIAP